jgi:hypothetical protein
MSEISQVRQAIARLMQQRERVLDQLLRGKPFIAAQVYERYKTCGNKTCKCHNGELHGPFLWIYQRKKDQKLISTTVDGPKEAEAKRLAASYQHWLGHRQQLRELDQQIQRRLDELEGYLEQDARAYVTRRKPGRPRKDVAAEDGRT